MRDPVAETREIRQDPHPSQELLHREEIESRWEAAPSVGLLIALQLLVTVLSREHGWRLWKLPWWGWLLSVALEAVLLVPLSLSWPRRRLQQLGLRREAVISLLALTSVANGLLVVMLIGSLVTGSERSGGRLLLEAIVVWATNVIAFGLWFWAFDRGGPVRRLEPDPPPPDFQFPQLENPPLAEPGWRPHLIDYVYVSFTNSIAFSPTDVMPLTRWAKVLMLAESGLSAVTILLVAARAVNIFR